MTLAYCTGLYIKKNNVSFFLRKDLSRLGKRKDVFVNGQRRDLSGCLGGFPLVATRKASGCRCRRGSSQRVKVRKGASKGILLLTRRSRLLLLLRMRGTGAHWLLGTRLLCGEAS
jgi:hypothetical protein